MHLIFAIIFSGLERTDKGSIKRLLLAALSAGYAGSRCEEDIGECSSSPCLAGGDCVERSWAGRYGSVPGLPPAFSYDKAEGYICSCKPGFTGKMSLVKA